MIAVYYPLDVCEMLMNFVDVGLDGKCSYNLLLVVF